MSCFLLFKALVLITLGRNDFVNNYYLVPNSTRSRQFILPNYVCYLISKCRKNLMKRLCQQLLLGAQLYKISPIYSSQLCLLSHLQVPKKSNEAI
ncbi:unnamed protein product, partial [Vitis vinifera]